MNNYIKIKMEPTSSGVGGTFSTVASFKIDNIIAPFNNVEVKIDTGCSVSMIPLAKFKILSSMCNTLKSNDIKSNIDYLRSYGVETGGQKHSIPTTYDEKMNCTALKFKHRITDFKIGGVCINHDFIHVNYNRKGNILIGMDILKDWDIHMGISKSGEYIFLACPKDSLNDDYFLELNRTFGIGDSITTAELFNP